MTVAALPAVADVPATAALPDITSLGRPAPRRDAAHRPRVDGALQPRRGRVGCRGPSPWRSPDRPTPTRCAPSSAWCVQHGVPVVPRGAGTGLSGGANAVAGGVVVSFERMTAVLRIDPVERLAVVQPGVVNDDLRAACAEQGLWYPPDPASSPWSTIGGNVATNAGGVCCVKYGVTGDYVLALEVVTGTGELVRDRPRDRQGRRRATTSCRCSSAPRAPSAWSPRSPCGCARPARRSTPSSASSTRSSGPARPSRRWPAPVQVPSALELLDRHCLTAVNDWKNLGIEADCEAILLARVDGPGAAGVAEAEAVLACFEGAGASWAARSEDDAEADAMFAARRLAYPALERLGPVLTEDVCVPVGRVPEMLARVQAIGERHDVLIANIAHAGDGNLHPLIITPPGDEAARVRAQAAFDEIIAEALAVRRHGDRRARGRAAQARRARGRAVPGRRRDAPRHPPRPRPARGPQPREGRRLTRRPPAPDA